MLVLRKFTSQLVQDYHFIINQQILFNEITNTIKLYKKYITSIQTFAKGARQFVVQLALEMMLRSGV